MNRIEEKRHYDHKNNTDWQTPAGQHKDLEVDRHQARGIIPESASSSSPRTGWKRSDFLIGPDGVRSGIRYEDQGKDDEPFRPGESG